MFCENLPEIKRFPVSLFLVCPKAITGTRARAARSPPNQIIQNNALIQSKGADLRFTQ